MLKSPAKSVALLVSLVASWAGAPAQVFMSEAEALRIIAPQAAWNEEMKTLDDATRQALGQSTRLRFSEPSYRFQVARVENNAVAYALTLEEIGKAEPITFTVGLDSSGKVKEVILLVFRESRGAEVRDPRFLKQFRGKTARDPVQIDRDILNYAGATLSSQALARGVRKTLALYEHFYGTNGKPTVHELRRSTPSLAAPGHGQDARAPAQAFGAASGLSHSNPYVQARYLMGTVCAIEVYAPDRGPAERAANAAFAAMQEVDGGMSNYRPDSELSRLNQHAAREPVRVSEALFQVLSFAERVSEASGGAFDVTVAPLLRAWRFLPAGTNRERPVRSEIREVGYRHVHLDPAARVVRFALSGIEIDLGGIAKGYAVDRAVEALSVAGIQSARISAGGSTIYALGAPPDHPRGWPVTLATGETICLRDAALSTSGHSERFVQIDGRRYSHIFDPRRGQPVSTEISSVTVLAPTAMESDALTKPFFMLNEHEQARLREAFPRARVWISKMGQQVRAAAK